ncbi:MAG: sigma-70 family RNA polymerase sigma factor [Acutalibacter sp.]|nr:sigma-70 family RNA polymerase sigma factor [Acutalibacter sp.]
MTSTTEQERFIEENLGLVHLCAKRFSGKGVEYEDLFQAGCVGLVKAAEHFDSGRGVKFSTYAVPVILGEVRLLFREGRALRVSRTMQELGRQAREAESVFREETGRDPTVQELSEKLDLSPEKTALALGVSKAPMSLSAGEEELEIPVDAPEERVTERMTLHSLLLTLEERDRKLIFYRYFQGKTQTVTAGLLGMTQVQVSRREKKLLLYLRHEME